MPSNTVWRQVAPVVVSVLIIILVGVVRARSKTLAAITATMPINVPLALWIVYAAEGGDRVAVLSFTQSLFIGIVATAACLVVVWLAVRAGLRIGPVIVAGYLAWGAVLGLYLGVSHLLRR